MRRRWARVVIFAGLGLLNLAPLTAAAEEPPACERPPIKLNRYDEDYTFLSDPECRTSLWDPLKYIRLGRHPATHLSLGADIRERFEYFRNRQWMGGLNDAYLLHRLMVHGDLHLGEHVRGFVQLTNNFAIDRVGGPGPLDEDWLDLHQAFLDVDIEIPHVGALTIRAGRQEIDYEDARLITTRDGANVRLSFDAVRLMQHVVDWRIDALLAAPVETNRGIFDDGPIPGQLLWGAYALGPIITEVLSLDIFYFGLERRDAVFDQGRAQELRHTLGVRASGEPASFDYNLELVYQLGSFGAGDINAWTAALDAGYTFRSLPLKPRLGLQLNATSGDRDPDDPNLQTFNPLFPQASYFSDANLIGPLNHIDVHPAITLQPAEGTTIMLHYDAFWRESLGDGLYNSGGVLLASGRGSRARYVGSELALRIQWQVNRHTILVASYSRFLAGPFLRDVGLGNDLDFITFWMSYRI